MNEEHVCVMHQAPGRVVIGTRIAFTAPGKRLLATEWTTTMRYDGYDGWTSTHSRRKTHGFRNMAELRAWIDGLYAAQDANRVFRSGGTKLVFA